MANRLANTVNIFLVCTFYTPLLPWAPLAAILGLGLSYFIEKYLLLRRHTRPEEMSTVSITFMANMLPYMMMLWAVSNLLFARNMIFEFNKLLIAKTGETEVSTDTVDDTEIVVVTTSSSTQQKVGSIENLAYIAIGIVGLYILFPVRTLIQKMFGDNKEDEFAPYKDNFQYFLTDYDRSNPVTKKKGMDRMFDARKQAMDEELAKDIVGLDEEEQRKRKEDIEAAKKQLELEQAVVKKATFFDASKNYTQQRAQNLNNWPSVQPQLSAYGQQPQMQTRVY